MPSSPNNGSSSTPLLQIENLKVHFPVKHGLFSRVQGYVKAVDGVSCGIL